MPLLLALLLFSPTAHAGKVIFASDPYPPYIYEDAGRPQGSAIPALQKLLNIPVKDIEVRIIPWKRALKEAELGTIDIIGPMQKDPEKSHYLAYTKQLFVAEEAMWTLASNLQIATLNPKSVMELQAHNVGYVAGYEYAEPFGGFLLSPKTKKVEVPDIAQGLRLLHSGAIKLFICNSTVMQFYIEQEGLPAKAFTMVGAPIREDWGFFGISRKSPRMKAIIKKMEAP